MLGAAVLAAAAVASCCGGCGAVTPSPFEAAEVDPPPTSTEAIAIAMQLYADRTGLGMPEVRVRWWQGDRIPWGDGTITGITFACDDIWVWTPASRRVTATPLAHELAHCASIVAQNNDGDADHSSPTWWGYEGYAMQAYRALQRAGL